MRPRIGHWRRGVQFAVLFSIVAFPLLARYGHYLAARQLDKVVEAWEGSVPGRLLRAADAGARLGIPDGEGGVAARRPRKKILRRLQNFYGSPWSARVFGVSLTDLVAGAESISASRGLRGVLLTSLLIPLLLTALLGRVYCGWICPMGPLSALARRTRRVIEFLEIKLPSFGLHAADKYCVLGIGLLLALASGSPLIHHIYPPALFGREAHGIVSAFFDGAESGRSGLWTTGLAAGSLFLLLLFTLETLLLPNFWCRSLCPGGALYSLVGRFRLLRVARKPAACVDCVVCDRHCPMGLEPMSDRAGMECDNCGICIDVCPTDALAYAWKGPATSWKNTPAKRVKKKTAAGAAVLALMALAVATPAGAHHIMGIPHYAYDENYPQAPVLKLVERVGPWEVQLTGYPGNPTPGSRTEIHAYVYDAGTRAVFLREVRLEVDRVRPFGGRERIYGPEPSRSDDNLHKFFPTYPSEDNYELIVYLGTGAEADTLRFPMVVGAPGSPWKALGGFAGGLVLFLIIVRAVRIKISRRRDRVAA